MILDVTNRCQMGCSHCMMNSTMRGEHMSMSILGKAFDFIKKVNPTVLLLSGGEPTLHPNILDIIEYALLVLKNPKKITLLSNGLFFEENQELAEKILSKGIYIQVTNDKRFYPRDVKVPTHKNVYLENTLRVVDSFGRAKSNNLKEIDTLFQRKAPHCFNAVSVAKSGYAKNLIEINSILEQYQKFCSLRIDVNGDIGIGESNECLTIGNVSIDDEYTSFNKLKNINIINCNKCGLIDRLSSTALNAIK